MGRGGEIERERERRGRGREREREREKKKNKMTERERGKKKNERKKQRKKTKERERETHTHTHTHTKSPKSLHPWDKACVANLHPSGTGQIWGETVEIPWNHPILAFRPKSIFSQASKLTTPINDDDDDDDDDDDHREGTTKKLCDKDSAECSGELSGAISVQNLVLLGNDRQCPRIVQMISGFRNANAKRPKRLPFGFP